MIDPRLESKHSLSVGVSGIPAIPDTGGTEIDVLCMALLVKLRSHQLNHVHTGLATITEQFPYLRLAALDFRQSRGEFVDDVAQAMRLLVPRDLARDATGILHVLMAVENVGHGVRIGSNRIPQMN